ncbi:hypothetical protein OG21DRAFT_1420377, partial [Imleria badia]
RGAITWFSKQQSMVALSTTESEYIGLSNAGQYDLIMETWTLPGRAGLGEHSSIFSCAEYVGGQELNAACVTINTTMYTKQNKGGLEEISFAMYQRLVERRGTWF